MLEPDRIQPGYTVYASGRYVGTVEKVLEQHGVHYLHVRGGFQGASELFLPLATVRAIEGRKISLSLSREELAGGAWHSPPTAG